MRLLLLSATITALLASAMNVEAKTTPNRLGVTGTSSAAGSPEGTPTVLIEVPIAGVNTNAVCGAVAAPNPANTVITLNLGANAVVTGVGSAGTFTAFSPSWRSEATAIFRGAVQAETIALGFSNDDSPGVAVFDNLFDLTDSALSNITTGAAGTLGIELCEDFDDASVNPDGTFGAGTILRVACFNCIDPNAGVDALPAPTLNQWGLFALIGLFAGIGGLMARRYS